MKRQLPLVDIAGTSFCVDVLREELRQADNPANAIPFSVFDRDRDGYTFLYDTRIRNVPNDRADLQKLEDGMQWVTLPALMELDPEGIALKYGIPLSVLCPERYTPDLADGYDDEQEDF